MDKSLLTDKERKVYEYILSCSSAGPPPTVREIGAHVGIKSTSGVHKALKKLEELGYIKREARASRAIKAGNMPKSVNVPILGKITAGIPILAVEQVEDYLPVPSYFGNDSELFALRVSGLSMKNAGIMDGDIVIADRAAACDAGDIVIALIGEEATVKTLNFENGSPVLYPENPDFEPIYPETLEILGRVVGSFRKF